jgi:hypothetical protein
VIDPGDRSRPGGDQKEVEHAHHAL